MESFFEKLSELAAAGTPFVSVTLVDAIGSTPTDRGSKMLVTKDGLHFGTVGGGKVELACIERAQQMLAEPAGPRTLFVDWNLQRDVKMTCGGAVKLFFEAFNFAPWQIVIFGAGHCSNALVRLLVSLQCQLTVFDRRADWLAKMPDSPRLRKVCVEDLPGQVKAIPDGAFVLLMTTGHASDSPILIEILKTRQFPYLGVIGSKAKAATLRRDVLAAGLSEEDCQRFLCPMGLDLGTNHPAEIAVSIAAQLIQQRDRLAAASVGP